MDENNLSGKIDRIQLRPTGIVKDLRERGATNNIDASQMTFHILADYFNILKYTLSQIRLEPEEALLLVEIFKELDVSIAVAASLEYHINDIPSEYAMIREKIRSWSLFHRWSVLDAIRRYWLATHIENTYTRLVYVGLLQV